MGNTEENVGKDNNGNDYEFVIVNPQSDRESSREARLQLTLKRIRMNKMAETKFDPLVEAVKSSDKELVKVDTAPQDRSVLALPIKKRDCVETPAHQDSLLKVKQKRVLSEVIERLHKAKAMSSVESDSKKKHRDKPQKQRQKKQQQKKQQPKAALPQSANEASSGKQQVMHQSCQDEARAGTSGTGLLESVKLAPDHEFCLNTLKKCIDKMECTKVLKDTNLTKNQTEIIEQSLIKMSHMMSCIKKNSNRFRKTHLCLDCNFLISHQCMDMDFIKRFPFSTELMELAFILPGRTVICDCGFAFFHAHFRRRRTHLVVNTTTQRLMTHMPKYNRSIEFSCPKCFILIETTTRIFNVCCNLVKFHYDTSANHKLFYNTVKSSLRYQTDTLLLDDFRACSNGCCLIFHRCSEESEDPGTSSSQPA